MDADGVMRILEHTILEEYIYDVIVCLEMVKQGYIEKKSVKLDNGWKLSVSRYIENDGLKDYIETGLAVRMANYINGIKDTAIILYPQIEEWVRIGQEFLRYENITTKSGNLFLIKKNGVFFISDGLNTWEINEYERRKIAYAMRYRWYYVADGFKITRSLATYRTIPIKEPPKFYLLMEV